MDYIKSVDIGEGVTTVGKYAFVGCGNLVEMNLPPTIQTIESYACERCLKLESVTIPRDCTTIGSHPFNRNYALVGFKVDPENTVFEERDGIVYSEDLTTLYLYLMAVINFLILL